MKQPHLAIIGCGDLGSRVGHLLIANGWRVSALRRTASALPREFDGFAGDYTSADALAPIVEAAPSHVLFTPLPASRDVAGYECGFLGGVKAMAESGLLHHATLAAMVSSTRVFSESGGAWVDENSPLTTTDDSAQAIIAAEEALNASAKQALVVRATGIYGNLPGMLLSRVREGRASPDPQRYSNRIHRDDLALAIAQLLQRHRQGQSLPACVIATDDQPVPIGEVEAWLAQRLGVSLGAPTQTTSSPRGNRRCSNARLKSLGVTLRYPGYRDGYEQILAQS